MSVGVENAIVTVLEAMTWGYVAGLCFALVVAFARRSVRG